MATPQIIYTPITPIAGSYADTTTANTWSAIQSFSSGVQYAYAAKTSTYPITTADHTIDCTSGTFTVTLPTAVGTSGVGQVYNIKNSGTGVITVATTSSQTIDGATTITLNQWENLTIQSTNANWIIL